MTSQMYHLSCISITFSIGINVQMVTCNIYFCKYIIELFVCLAGNYVQSINLTFCLTAISSTVVVPAVVVGVEYICEVS